MSSNDSEKTILPIPCSQEFKAAWTAYAKRFDKPAATYARELLAKQMGYDLSSEPQPTRAVRKYKTREEAEQARKRAQADRNKILSKLYKSFLNMSDSEKARLLREAERSK